MTASSREDEKNSLLINTVDQVLDFFKENIDCFSEPFLKRDEFEKKLATNTNLKKVIGDLSQALIRAHHDPIKAQNFRKQYELAILALAAQGNDALFRELLETTLFFSFFKLNQEYFNAIVNIWHWDEKIQPTLNSADKLLLSYFADREFAQDVCNQVVKEMQTQPFVQSLAPLLKLPPKVLLIAISAKLMALFKTAEKNLLQQLSVTEPTSEKQDQALSTSVRVISSELPKGGLQQNGIFNKRALETPHDGDKPTKKRKKFNSSWLMPYLNELQITPQEKMMLMNNVHSHIIIQNILTSANDLLELKNGAYLNYAKPLINKILSACHETTNFAENVSEAVNSFKESLPVHVQNDQRLLTIITCIKAEIPRKQSTLSL